jgi:hypothetical protein
MWSFIGIIEMENHPVEPSFFYIMLSVAIKKPLPDKERD